MKQSDNNNRNSSNNTNEKIVNDPNTQQKSHPAQAAPDLKNEADNTRLKKEQPLQNNDVEDNCRNDANNGNDKKKTVLPDLGTATGNVKAKAGTTLHNEGTNISYEEER